MSDYGIWKTIKFGFWLGIGFIIPQLVVMYGGTVLTFVAMPSIMEMATDLEISADFDVEDYTADFDRTNQIELGPYEDKSKEGQLLIIGQIKNTGVKTARSVQLEAELYDSNGKFVYECSEYINKQLSPGETENYQIKCGCKDSAIPEYDSVTVRVTGAHGF